MKTNRISKNISSSVEHRDEWHRQYYIKNKDKISEYYKNNRNRFIGYMREYRKRDHVKLKLRKDYYLKTYGITMEQYEQMIVSQGNMCPICGGVLMGGRNTCVDHDHITGKIRQILCRDCNLILGIAKDRINTLERAVDYLKRWS